MEAQSALRASRERERELGDRFIDALGYCTRVHATQLRASDGRPYVAHLLRVTGLVIQDGGSEEEAIAALLHDAVEDQGGIERLNEIRERYGHVVAEIVDECTDSYGDPKPTWRRRKEQYLEELDRASPGALRVSLADKLDNVRTMVRRYRARDEVQWSRSGKSRDDLRWYYRALASKFCELRPGPLAAELGRAVAEIDLLIEAEERQSR